MMQKHTGTTLVRGIPNALSCTRILASAAMLFCIGSRPALSVTVLIIVLTDILDGHIARATNSESDVGATLDSIADSICFICIAAYMFITAKEMLIRYVLPLVCIFAIRLLSLFICWIRNGHPYALHTISNKLAGATIIACLFGIMAFNTYRLVPVTLVVAMLSAMEEMMIMVLIEVPDRNEKSIITAMRRRNSGPEP